MRKGPCYRRRSLRENREFCTVHYDEPLDEKLVGCLTCETIIGLSEEYRLAEFLQDAMVAPLSKCRVTDACECFEQMCVAT